MSNLTPLTPSDLPRITASCAAAPTQLVESINVNGAWWVRSTVGMLYIADETHPWAQSVAEWLVLLASDLPRAIAALEAARRERDSLISTIEIDGTPHRVHPHVADLLKMVSEERDALWARVAFHGPLRA